MTIRFNGELRETTDHCTVAAFLDQLNLVARHVAVEVNQQVIPRDRHADYVLREGDEIEVVTLVGGG